MRSNNLQITPLSSNNPGISHFQRIPKGGNKGKQDPGRQVPEWRLQAEAVSVLLKKRDFEGWPIELAAGLEGQRRTKVEQARAKVTGMTAGEPDLRVYLPAGRLGSLEFKTATGRLSAAQKERHARLVRLGHIVGVVSASTPEEAAAKVIRIVAGWLGLEGID